MEGWLSGRKRFTANEVWVYSPSRVRIPYPPQILTSWSQSRKALAFRFLCLGCYTPKMRKIKDVPYDEVVAFFEKEHPIDDSSPHFAGNYWAMKHLEWANDAVDGVWSLCELEVEDILGIVFAYHTAEETELCLVDEEGMTLAQTIEYIQANEEMYAQVHPVCWTKMMYWQGEDFTPVLLSTKPTPDKGKRSNVDQSLGNLFHQDGLHRLTRWGLDGRFDPETYASGPKLTAFISGKF